MDRVNRIIFVLVLIQKVK